MAYIRHFVSIIILTIEFSTFLPAQPAVRFQPFDWVLYTRTGAIQSFSEGMQYVYIATHLGGVYRWDYIRKEFALPITTSQGLTSNHCTAVFKDKGSGTLWIATEHTLDYVFNLHGTWTHQNLKYYGLSEKNRIDHIAASTHYIWVFYGKNVLKLDRYSGGFIGRFTEPDEKIIASGSGHGIKPAVLRDLGTYSVSDGWLINGKSVVDSQGRTEVFTTFISGRYDDRYIGTDRGTLLVGDGTMKMLSPVHVGLLNRGVGDIVFGDDLILSSTYRTDPFGLTLFNPDEISFNYQESELESNSVPEPVWRMVGDANELWVGGKSVAVYNENDRFWKPLGEIQSGNGVTAMTEGGGYIWIGTVDGLMKVDTLTNHILRYNVLPNKINMDVRGLGYQNHRVWVATSGYLLTVNPESDQVENQGLETQLGFNPGFMQYQALSVRGKGMMVATSQGIFYRSNPAAHWTKILNLSDYSGQPVRTLDWDGDLGVLNFTSGFMLFTLEGHFTQKYNYDFLGTINCAYIDGALVWLGTNQGLIQFNTQNETFK